MDETTTSEASMPRADAMLEMLGLLEEGDGTTCALLTPAIRAKLRELRGGQVLEVRVDAPEAREDIASWCRISGHELVAFDEGTPGMLRAYVRKKPD